MRQKYYIVLVISILLMGLSLGISAVNYYNALKSAKEQLIHHSLPLSLDNIYTEIQKQLIEPYLVSSMMASDTFVLDWIVQDEIDEHKIVKYLGAIKNRYNMDNAFLVTEKTKKYYTQNGFVETINPTNIQNKWYYQFKQSTQSHEINLDTNDNLSNYVMMFINYKIFNSDYELIGVTGVALRISYIDEMLKRFRTKYNFIATFFDQDGRVVLAERELGRPKKLDEMPSYKNFKDLILSKETHLFEYEQEGQTYILTAKYIPELNLYLTVEVSLDNFIKGVKETFAFNLLVSLLITLAIALIVYRLIHSNNTKLEHLAQNDALTTLSNRRHFEWFLAKKIDRFKSNNKVFYLVFIDVDNFKMINDTKGHHVGDMVLRHIALILNQFVQNGEMLGRWGGEEFVMTYTPHEQMHLASEIEHICHLIESDEMFIEFCDKTVTVSIGVSGVQSDDTLGSLIVRADEAMYLSKQNGKNRVTIQ